MRELARLDGRRGELVLREADDGHHEVISNGMFLMDTRDGRSERGLVAAALDALGNRERGRLLLGGLGVGCSLAAALADPRVARVVVVELEPAVVELVRTTVGARTGADLDDPRVTVVVGDVHDVLEGERHGVLDAICLDVDNGPGWTLGGANDRLYTSAGLELARSRLASGGVLAVWSAHDAPWFVELLEAHVGPVETHTWQVPRGEPDRVWVVRTTADVT